MGQFCLVTTVLVILLVSLSLTLVALLTDSWYEVSTEPDISPEARRNYNFKFGLWRLCYDDMPSSIASDDRYSKEGSCIYIHKELIQREEDALDFNRRLRLHLSRTVLGCSIAAAAVMLAGLLSLLCGVWPARCDPVKRPSLYLATSFLLLLATMCGITSGVCFIAVRDLDNSEFNTYSVMPPAPPEYASQAFTWSFMLHWIGSGLCLVDSFLLLCLLKNSYEFVNEDSKYSPYNTM